MNEEEFDAEDREWIYLTHEERQMLQKQVNGVMRAMLDGVALAVVPQISGRALGLFSLSA